MANIAVDGRTAGRYPQHRQVVEIQPVEPVDGEVGIQNHLHETCMHERTRVTAQGSPQLRHRARASHILRRQRWKGEKNGQNGLLVLLKKSLAGAKTSAAIPGHRSARRKRQHFPYRMSVPAGGDASAMRLSGPDSAACPSP